VGRHHRQPHDGQVVDQVSDLGDARSMAFTQSNDIATLTERVDRVLEITRDTNNMLGKLIEQDRK
jgi:hypothetical protein